LIEIIQLIKIQFFRKMTNHKYILLLSLILSTTIFSCKNDGAGETMTEQEPESRFITVSKEQFDFNEMKLAKVELIDYSNTLQLNGNVILNTGATANISSPMEGKITGLKTRIGEYVRKGETLFSVQNLELIQMQQQYLELESQMAVFEEEFARKENLYKENVVVKSDFLQAKQKLDDTKTRIKSMEKQFEVLNVSPSGVNANNLSSTISITAPISGQVAEVSITNGEYVMPDHSLMKIINPSDYEIEVGITQDKMSQIKKGQVARIFPNANENGVAIGQVARIVQDIDMEDKTMKAYITTNGNQTTNLVPGSYVRVSLVLGDSTQPGIEEQAIIDYYGKDVLLVLEKQDENNYYFEALPVRKTGTSGSKAIIGDDMDGKQILINGGFQLMQ